MTYLPLIPLFIIVYVVTVDRNVLDYLYLRLFLEPVLWVRTNLLKTQLIVRLKYDRYLLRRGYLPSRFMEMAREISPDSPKSDSD